MYHDLPQILPGRHYLAWITGGFLAGIFYGIYASALSYVSFWGILLYSIGFLVFALLLLTLCALPKQASSLHRDLFLLWFICLAFTFGVLRVYAFDCLQSASLKATANAQNTYTGVIADKPQPSNSGKSFGCTVKVTHAETEHETLEVKGKIMLYAPSDSFEGIQIGDTVTFPATLLYPSGSSYSGGFSLRHYLYRQGISYSVYTKELTKAEVPVQLNSLSHRLGLFGERLRESAFYAIDTSFQSRTQEAALLKGIMLGNREDFSAEQYQSFVDSGFVHITSVSGMHIMFLFGFVTFLFRKLRLPHFLIRLLCIPIFILFGAVATFTPSVNRAIIMTMMTLLAAQIQRVPDSLTSLSFSALVLSFLNPYIITDYSFLLSFGATLGIIIFSGPINRFLLAPYKKLTNLPKSLRFIAGEISSSTALSLSGNLGLGFFLARFFNRFSWGSVVGNIALTPLTSFSFIGGFFLWGIFMLSQPLASFLAQKFFWIPLWLINHLAEFFAKKFFQLYIPTPHISFLGIYLFLCGVLYYLLKKK